MKKFKKIERKGLPGGPNEQFTYITGMFSTEGYKSDSPDVNNPFNIIDSGNITMEGVEFPVMGTDNLGNSQMMMPGMNYQFPGDQVFEIPMAQKGKSIDDEAQRKYLIDWLKARKATGRFDDQLTEKELNEYIKNIETVQQLTKDEFETMFPESVSNNDFYPLFNSPSGQYIFETDEMGKDNPTVHHYHAEPSFLTRFTNMFDGLDSVNSVKIHELTHAMTRAKGSGSLRKKFPDAGFVDYPIEQAIRNIPIGFGDFYDDPSIFDSYEGDPEEILAQLMQYRYNFNVDPNRVFTEDDIEEVMENVKQLGDSGIFGLDIFTPENIIRLLNEVAAVDSKDTNTMMAQKGGGVNEEGVKQYEFLKEYMNSPMYAERLKMEFPDYTDEEIAEEVKTRLENVMQTRVGFLPESSKYSENIGDVQGFVDPENFPNMMMLRPEYSALTPDNPPYGYNTTPIHEWQHVADEVGNRMPQSTKDLISSFTKDNVLDMPKEDYYYTQPTEIVARIQELRYLLDDQGIYDAKKGKFTQEDLDKAKKNDRIKYNARFQDLMDNLNSDEALIELMNSIAAVDTMEQDNIMMAKKGGSVSWQWKGKTYSGTLIPSMETATNRYARTENGKIKTLPKRQDGGEKSFFEKAKDNFLYNINPLYQADDLLQLLGIPANLVRESIEGIGGKGDGSFDFKNIFPDIKGTTILDDTPDQVPVSETLGVDGFWKSLGVDMVTDPTTYVGAGILKNLLQKGGKKTIEKTAPKIIKETKNIINISDTPKRLPRPPKEDYTFYRYADDDSGILDALDMDNPTLRRSDLQPIGPRNLTFFAPTPYGFKGYGGKLFGANIVPKKPYMPYKGQVWDPETVQKLIDEGYDAIIPMYGRGDDIRDAYEIIPLDKSIIRNLEIIRALGGESLPMNQRGGIKTLLRKIAEKTDDFLPKLQSYLRSTYRGADEFVSEIDWGKWNEAIPKNKPLLEEYNLIEKTTKANKTWMKNADGTPFSGTPEQFVQINSKNFKNAFPDGYQSVYRGVPGEDIEKYGPLGKKPNLGSGIFTAEEDVAKHYNFNVGSTRRDGHTLNLAMRNSDNSLVLDALGNFHADLNVIGTSKEMLKKNIDIFKKRLQQSIDDGVDPEVVMKINRNSASNLPAKLESYENFYKNYDEIVSNPVYQKLVKYKRDLLNSRKGTKKPGFNNFSTDDLAEFLQKEKLDNIQLRYVDDGNMGNTNIHNQVPGNYLKSLQGNDGMFDMSNPDIYKQKGGEYDPYMDIDPESQKRRDELLGAIDKVVETQGGDPNLKALLIMTAAMENSLGADSSAYGRDYTRGPMSMDDIAYITNFEIGKGARDYSKVQKKYFDWFESLGFDLENMDYHQRNNVLANVAGARMQYGLVDDPLPKADDPEAMYKYYMDFYNRTKADHKDRFMKNYNAFIKGKQKGGETVYKIYKKFMQGGFTGSKAKEAEKIFDKLNRVHYKDAKKLGMTPTNYLMTFVIPNS